MNLNYYWEPHDVNGRYGLGELVKNQAAISYCMVTIKFTKY